MEPKTCLECGKPVQGRSDKKFCSDYCRNQYNYRNKKDSTNLMRNINNALRKNRHILMEANPSGKTKVPRDKLLRKGFSFDYHTQTHTTKKGDTYFLCYDQAYLPLDEEWLLLVEWK